MRAAAFCEMDLSLELLCPSEKYCSVVTELDKHPCNRLMPSYYALTSCPVLTHLPWTMSSPIHKRCSWVDRCLHCSDVPCAKCIGSTPLKRNTPVLARREPDGFYYLATIIEESEGERGVFLVEFDRPHPRGEKYQTGLQKTASDDIIQYFDAMRHCIVPGDKVLAPWEPQLTRYGPGSVVLGIEMRDPLRVIEDEEITVSFWNGKRIKVPSGVAVWIPSAAWERIVERLHLPITSRPKLKQYPQNITAYVCNTVSTIPLHAYNPDDSCKHKWTYFASPYYSQFYPCYSHHKACWLSSNTRGSSCCCQAKCQHWWPLVSKTTKDAEDIREQELADTPALFCLEPKQEAKGEAPATAVSSCSSSSDDSECDKEVCLTKITMVDRAVNTDSSVWEKPRTDSSEQVKPDWKYWKRSCPEPAHKKPGSSNSSNCFTDKKSESNIWLDLLSTGPSNQSAMFEAISCSPSRRLTVKELLNHNGVKPSRKSQAPPVHERLGENEREHFQWEQALIEQQRKAKLQQRERERKREEEAEQQYANTQEHHRKMILQQLQKEETKTRERAGKEDRILKAKQQAQLQRSLQRQSLAEEDKRKEQRRQTHLQRIRQKLDQREFQKCVADRMKETQAQEARRKRVDIHYKQLVEKLYETERQAQTKSAGQRMRARVRIM